AVATAEVADPEMAAGLVDLGMVLGHSHIVDDELGVRPPSQAEWQKPQLDVLNPTAGIGEKLEACHDRFPWAFRAAVALPLRGRVEFPEDANPFGSNTIPPC